MRKQNNVVVKEKALSKTENSEAVEDYFLSAIQKKGFLLVSRLSITLAVRTTQLNRFSGCLVSISQPTNSTRN
jgi:hypothetical protein